MVVAEDTPRHKPEPDVFLEAARRLGAAANGAWCSRTPTSAWKRARRGDDGRGRAGADGSKRFQDFVTDR